jgi:hypothetical protein
MRQCGECTACCTALAVQELDKPRYRPCQHLGEAGCGAYQSRPGSCRDYQCLWLQGFLGDEDRPDRLGVIVTVTRDPHRPELGNIPMLVEYQPGALRKPRVIDSIRQFREHKPVVVITPAGQAVMPQVTLTVRGQAPLSEAA